MTRPLPALPATRPQVLHVAASTAGVPAARRPEAWRDAMGPLVDVQPEEAPAGFHGAVSAYAVPVRGHGGEHIVFSNCVSGAVTLDRQGSRIARDGLGHYAFQLFQSGGQGVQRLRGGETHTGAGGLLALDMRQPFRIRRGAYHALALFVPRSLVESRVADPDGLHGRSVPAGAPLAALAGDYLRLLADSASRMDAPHLQTALDAALHLVLGAMEPALEGSPELARARNAALFTRAQRCVEAHLLEPALGPELLARQLAISRSALYRLFAPHGGVAAYVRRQRLRRALQALQRSDAPPVTQVAHDHGFGSASDFARAFRRAYGVPPSELRGGTGGARMARVPFPYAAVMRPAPVPDEGR